MKNYFYHFLLFTFLISQSCKKEETPTPQKFGYFKDIDGNLYSYTDIKGNTWTLQNLSTTRFQNGDTIMEAKTDDEWEWAIWNKIPAWCHYDNDSLKGIKYGKIYNFYAVRDLKKLAPDGWHISTEKEWYNLENSYGGEWNAGQYLKGPTGWADDGNGNNESFFNAVPGGRRFSIGSFYGENKSARFWTSTEESTYSNYCALLPSINNLLNITVGEYDDGFYVRCVKDK